MVKKYRLTNSEGRRRYTNNFLHGQPWEIIEEKNKGVWKRIFISNDKAGKWQILRYKKYGW